MPSLTIHVDNRGRNTREIQEKDNMRWPRNNSWQHDDRKPRETSRYERNQSPNKSDYYHLYVLSTRRNLSPHQYENLKTANESKFHYSQAIFSSIYVARRLLR